MARSSANCASGSPPPACRSTGCRCTCARCIRATAGVSRIWQPGLPVDERFLDHGIEKTATYLESPVRAVTQEHRRLDWRLDDGAALPFAVLEELRDEGYTHYVIAPVPYAAGPVNAISWATRRPGGFAAEHLQAAGRVAAGLFGGGREQVAVPLYRDDAEHLCRPRAEPADPRRPGAPRRHPHDHRRADAGRSARLHAVERQPRAARGDPPAQRLFRLRLSGGAQRMAARSWRSWATACWRSFARRARSTSPRPAAPPSPRRESRSPR